MGEKNTTKRAEGKVEEIVGGIKKTVGRVIGNEQMEAEGKALKVEGQLRQESAKAGERVKGAVEQVTGTVKKKVGQLIDNEQMEVEGKLKALKGEARQEANR